MNNPLKPSHTHQNVLPGLGGGGGGHFRVSKGINLKKDTIFKLSSAAQGNRSGPPKKIDFDET